MCKLKICHIVEATGGGVKTHILQLATNINNNKFEQYFIVSPKRNKNIKEELEKSGIKNSNIIEINMERNINPLADSISLFKILKIIRNQRYDIVHCHSAKAGFIGRVAAKLAGYNKIIYTPHALPFNKYTKLIKKTIFITLERFVGKFTNNIIGVSKSEKRYIEECKLVNSGNVVCIENAVFLNREIMNRNFADNNREDLSLKNESIILTFVGRLSKQKNPLFVLELAKRLPDITFQMVGEGEYFDELNQKKHQFDLKNLILMGQRNDVELILKKSDFLIIPSYWEGLPYVVLEAMNLGIPVLGSDIDGISDVVIDGFNGYLIDPDNVDSALKVIKLLNKMTKSKMSLNCINTIKENHQIYIMINKLEKLYNQL